MRFQNKVAVITGGASGIGAASALNFAKRGAKIIIADTNIADATKIALEVNGLAIECNVGKESDIELLVTKTEAHFGPIDIFFCNAAIANGADPLNTDLQVWQDQWQINLMAHIYALRAVLPSMLSRGKGYFIHSASMAGILTSHGNLPYAVTKHAVVGLAEWMSITYHDQGLKTSLLAPLGVRTPMLGDTNSAFARNAAGPIRDPEEVAEMVAIAVEKERFLILTDEIAQTWMNLKTNDLERWLHGMRRMQSKIANEC